jgi:hypothetical protein
MLNERHLLLYTQFALFADAYYATATPAAAAAAAGTTVHAAVGHRFRAGNSEYDSTVILSPLQPPIWPGSWRQINRQRLGENSTAQ